LYRIAQEAVANAVKHALARRIVVELDAADGELRLNIFDDGVGLRDVNETHGLGLKMMRHGATLIGADFKVSRQNPAGTIISCILPQGARPDRKYRDEI
jgi:two-component system sensor histidine kinase UhpB